MVKNLSNKNRYSGNTNHFKIVSVSVKKTGKTGIFSIFSQLSANFKQLYFKKAGSCLFVHY